MRLIDHAVDALRIATTLPGGSADPLVLRQRSEAALREFAAAAAQAGHAAEGIEAARFALVALIDERAMAPGCPVRQAWLDQPLQLLLFECSSAGEAFYQRLERWRRPRSEGEADVLEVYQACLALGFRGMMAAETSDHARRQLAEQTAAEVVAVRRPPEHGLSPRGLPQPAAEPEASAGQPARRLWLVPVLALAGIAVCWLLCRLWISAAGSAVQAELR